MASVFSDRCSGFMLRNERKLRIGLLCLLEVNPINLRFALRLPKESSQPRGFKIMWDGHTNHLTQQSADQWSMGCRTVNNTTCGKCALVYCCPWNNTLCNSIQTRNRWIHHVAYRTGQGSSLSSLLCNSACLSSQRWKWAVRRVSDFRACPVLHTFLLEAAGHFDGRSLSTGVADCQCQSVNFLLSPARICFCFFRAYTSSRGTSESSKRIC